MLLQRAGTVVSKRDLYLAALGREPVRFVCDVIADWDPKPIVMYDMAHVLGLYGAFQTPLAEGADVITGSTHKTFFGPQRGVIAGNFPKGSLFRKLWIDIKGRAFPGSTSFPRRSRSASWPPCWPARR